MNDELAWLPFFDKYFSYSANIYYVSYLPGLILHIDGTVV